MATKTVDAPVAPTPEPPAPTTEELQKKADDLYASMKWGAAPKVDPVDPAPQPTPAPEPVVVAAPEPVAPAPAVVAPAPSPDITAIAKATAREAVIAMQELPAPRQSQPATPKPSIELTKEDQKDYDVIQFLERSQPGKFAGKSAAYLNYIKAHYEYQDQWSEKNAGQQFDPDDDQHKAWYDAHQPPVDADDIDAGKEGLVEERIFNNKVKPELDRINAEKVMAQAWPKITQNVHRNILKIANEVSPAIAAVLRDASGNPVFSRENLDKADAVDPIAFDELNRAVKGEVESMLVALEMTAVEGANYQLNPSTNPAHAAIGSMVAQAEQALLNKSAVERMRGNREFITISDWQQRERQISMSDASPADKSKDLQYLDSRYWCLGVDDIESEIVRHFADRIKKSVEYLDGRARKKYGQSPAQGQALVVTPAPAPRATTPETPSEKPKPPSATGGGDAVQTAHLSQTAQKSFSEQMAETHFRR